MKTPRQIEIKLTDAAIRTKQQLNKSWMWADEIAHARQVFQSLRKAEGFSSTSKLFSTEISKLNKDDVTILGLPLLPATHSGIGNLCAFADSCANDCVAFSGNGSFPKVFKSRMAKTNLLVNYPNEFMVLMVSELFDAVWKAEKQSQELAVRLNTYSDIRWERIAPWLFEMFAGVQFYDYTKHTTRSRPESSRPKNYHLTYSVSENTTPAEIEKAANLGRPLAVVVSIRSGKVSTLGTMRPIPETWGGLKVVDGDESDSRWTTPPESVVILRRKHTMDKNHPMIQHAETLREGLEK
jgi:hypothetical protein